MRAGGAGSLHTMNRRQLVDETGFAYSWWYTWPDEHLNYMRVRARTHGNFFFSLFITGFRWARNNVEHPGWFSWLFRPLSWTYLFFAKRKLTSPQTRSLITSSRTALTMWEGVREKKWSFLSPPGQLRDQGVRTGRYKVFIDSEEDPAVEAVDGAIYNEDLAVAVADEIEGPRMTFLHWSVVGRVGLAAW
ncbi:uncharacterized protein EURHEDRAFT_519466 [Aspergillus ruber CBS 135680]|uniref:Uncharacterized protein n=1 Tax=Aspergillus ruber (strain CBS 135680) TaxID=1388766 RepID=A0A017RYU4_ASPRC|nr:uncharacterized protein EURHEDRAFT_519466 [Aspergillus ruber CBS 135680]EYE89953.1 hypothetical protein EURHEDRAFT_519466 [Aspergillus ruber CBS 135680]